MSLKLLSRVALALALTAVALSISGCVAHTEHFGTETDTMVYCSRYEQHRAFEDGMNYLLDNYIVRWYEDYKTFFVDRGYTIVEQSITPYYQIDCYKWSETGELQLKKNDESLCWNYIANVVDVDNNICAFAIISYNYGSGAPGDNINFKPGFTGCALFSENKVHVSSTDIHEIDDGDVISVSYADHAERIKTILGIDYIIPPENVRLVSVSVREICPLFYIKTENIDGFIPTGNTFVTESAPFISSNTFIPLRDRFISYDEMKKYADLLYEKNGEYEFYGRYVHKLLPTDRNINRCFIQSYVNEDVRTVLKSYYYGTKAIQHDQVTFALGDDYQTFSGSTHSFENQGGQYEILSLAEEDALTALAFIGNHQKDRIKVTLKGSGTYTYYLNDNEKKALIFQPNRDQFR